MNESWGRGGEHNRLHIDIAILFNQLVPMISQNSHPLCYVGKQNRKNDAIDLRFKGLMEGVVTNLEHSGKKYPTR